MTDHSERVARSLREHPPRLDDVARARMEKGLLEAARDAQLSRIDSDVPGAPRRRALVRGGGGLLLLAAAAALVIWLPSAPEQGPGGSVATVRLYEDGQSIARETVPEGGSVSTGPRQRAQVEVGPAQVDVTPESATRFVAATEDRLHVWLDRGAVEVEFHPDRRGEQSLIVETRTARVEVVGTVFRVEVGPSGATTVAVYEGVVRVVTHAGDVSLVRAGSSTRVSPVDVPSDAVTEPGPEPVGGVVEPGLPQSASVSDVTPDSNTTPRVRRRGTERSPEVVPALPDDAPVEGAQVTAEVSEPSPQPAEPPISPPVELSADARFDLAEVLQQRGQHRRSRHMLHAIARAPERRADRVRAWSLIAESHAAQGDLTAAAEAYRRAARAGRGSMGGLNALFALGRLLERRMNDPAGAQTVYRQLLLAAPGGPHSELVRGALCRLGEPEHCE